MHMREIFTSFKPRPSVGTLNDQPSLTEKSHADSCDINVIVKRALNCGNVSGLLPSRPLVYGDATVFSSYHESLNMITQTQQAFDSLPSEFRAKFGNSISEFLRWLDDPKNTDEAIKYGLKFKTEQQSAGVPDTLVIKGTTDTVSGGSSNNGALKDE